MLFWLSCVLAGLSLHCLAWLAMRPVGRARPAPDHVRHLLLRLAWPWLDVLAAAFPGAPEAPPTSLFNKRGWIRPGGPSTSPRFN